MSAAELDEIHEEIEKQHAKKLAALHSPLVVSVAMAGAAAIAENLRGISNRKTLTVADVPELNRAKVDAKSIVIPCRFMEEIAEHIESFAKSLTYPNPAHSIAEIREFLRDIADNLDWHIERFFNLKTLNS